MELKHDMVVSCHAGSMYSDALVLYEKPERDKRVFAVVIADNDLRWERYCNDVQIKNLQDGCCVLVYNGQDQGRFPCYKIDNKNVLADVRGVMDKRVRKTTTLL